METKNHCNKGKQNKQQCVSHFHKIRSSTPGILRIKNGGTIKWGLIFIHALAACHLFEL
jgi:hypothetical protein